ncbi:phosphopantetheine-binding protein [Erwinia tasmaniensis]|uniref:phosphopantetheine-binding protein n=1 Tax=Erwinia tasmaniensis TaxID=338565 RepID=UPI003A4D7D0D
MEANKQLIQTINDVVATTLNRPLSDILPDKHLCYDLLADSLALLDLVLALEDKFKIEYKEEYLAETDHVRDLYRVVTKLLCQ